jgi:hypothetical protein
VNALFRDATELNSKTPGKPGSVTARAVDLAADSLVRGGYTHIDHLATFLRQRGVASVLDPVFSSSPGPSRPGPVQYETFRQRFLDLGLVVETGEKGYLKPYNPLCGEVMLRSATDELGSFMKRGASRVRIRDWRDTAVPVNDLLKSFQEFWKSEADAFRKKDGARGRLTASIYDRSFPVFMLAAFLHKALGSSAVFRHEYAQGRGWVAIRMFFDRREYLIAAESGGGKPAGSSAEDVAKALAESGDPEGWLVVFDRETGKNKEKKPAGWSVETFEGVTVNIARL